MTVSEKALPVAFNLIDKRSVLYERLLDELVESPLTSNCSS